MSRSVVNRKPTVPTFPKFVDRGSSRFGTNIKEYTDWIKDKAVVIKASTQGIIPLGLMRGPKALKNHR